MIGRRQRWRNVNTQHSLRFPIQHRAVLKKGTVVGRDALSGRNASDDIRPVVAHLKHVKWLLYGNSNDQAVFYN